MSVNCDYLLVHHFDAKIRRTQTVLLSIHYMYFGSEIIIIILFHTYNNVLLNGGLYMFTGHSIESISLESIILRITKFNQK